MDENGAYTIAEQIASLLMRELNTFSYRITSVIQSGTGHAIDLVVESSGGQQVEVSLRGSAKR